MRKIFTALRGSLTSLWRSVYAACDGDFTRRKGVNDYPLFSQFPDLGPDGEVTIDCSIRPSRPLGQDSGVDQDGYPRVDGVAPKRLGAVYVEIDQYGLRLCWQPYQAGDESFLSPFGRSAGAHSPPEPGAKNSDDGSDHGNA